MKIHPTYFFILALLLSSCAVEPQPINYGSDACNYCSMTIVDSQHACQFVTTKGKCYKFDAVECMLNKLKDFDEAPVKLYLVCDYANPGELTDATTSTYLISEKIPSPMGAFLSSFAQQKDADSVHREDGGQLLTWAQLKKEYGI